MKPYDLKHIMHILTSRGYEAHVAEGVDPDNCAISTNAPAEELLNIFPHGTVTRSKERSASKYVATIDDADISQYQHTVRRDTIVSYLPPKSLLSYTFHPSITNIERELKRDFDSLGVQPHVATFMVSPPLRIAVTVASEHSINYEDVHALLWNIVHARPHPNEHAEVCVKQNLARHGYPFVAICSRQDVFSQTRGEVIALGRLRKRLIGLVGDVRCAPVKHTLDEMLETA